MSLEQPKFERTSESKEYLKEFELRGTQTSLYDKLAEDHFGPRNRGEEMPPGKKDETRQWNDFGWWYFRPGSYNERVKKDEENTEIQNAQRGELAKEFDKVCREYKIHLQPTIERDAQGRVIKDQRARCLDRLLESISQDPKLEKSINCLKVSLRKEKFLGSEWNMEESIKKGMLPPEIVIYTYGRKNFEMVLDRLVKQFQDFEKYGSGLVPRDNYKINDLIFVAQSGGDFKEGLRRSGLIDRYFDKQLNYSFRNGEKPPRFKKK